MLANESPPVPEPGRGHDPVENDPPGTVVWVRGAQDAATCAALSATLTQAAGLDDGDLVVDLSGVTFMDASTIGALVGARNSLGIVSRLLRVRDPSARARRLLDVCGLTRLIDEHTTPPQPSPPPLATALGSWVDVTARSRSPGSARAAVTHEPPSEERLCVMAQRPAEPARSIPKHRALS